MKKNLNNYYVEIEMVGGVYWTGVFPAVSGFGAISKAIKSIFYVPQDCITVTARLTN